jgi:hypothetical protein
LDFEDDIDQETINEYWNRGVYVPVLKDGFTLIDTENNAPIDPPDDPVWKEVLDERGNTKMKHVYNDMKEEWEWVPIQYRHYDDVVEKHAYVYNALKEDWEWVPIRYRYNEDSKMWTWDDVTGSILRRTEVRYTNTELSKVDLNTWEKEHDGLHPITQEWLKVGRGGADDKIIDGSTVISRVSSHSYVYNERLRKWIYLAEPRVGHFVLELMLEY